MRFQRIDMSMTYLRGSFDTQANSLTVGVGDVFLRRLCVEEYARRKCWWYAMARGIGAVPDGEDRKREDAGRRIL
jgi:hypothetical protein